MGNTKLKPAGAANGTFAQNVEILGAANDFIPESNGLLHVFLEADTAVLIQYTVDSGGAWKDLGTSVVNTKTEFKLPVIQGQTINLRTNDVGGLTCDVVLQLEV